MTKIRIQTKGLDRSITANIGPGAALLIGRAPDPRRIDWSLLRPQPSACAMMNPRIDPDRYQLTTLTVPSPRASANHILALHDGPTFALFDLSSRNGSWIRLEPSHPVVMAGALEVTLSLAGSPGHEVRLLRPAHAEWTGPTDFGAAVVRALTAWLAQHEAPVQCLLCPVDSDINALPLADGQGIMLRVQGTIPFSPDEMHDTISQYVHDQNARFMQLERRVCGMVASSPAIRQILHRLAEAAAAGRRTILLGPTGVGKELLARSYHGYSLRHGSPFVTVNCALLEKDLLHAQLFGARRGSFTGAVADVVGLIEAANGGTLFLDELGEMSAEVQKALLRFLDSRGEYYRLGDSRPRMADVQIVCASNVDLDDAACRSQCFRSDLWYRLASTVLRIPPLRERPDDILAFLSTRSIAGTNLRVAECLTRDSLAAVLQDPWPGNFRDLENFIERLPPVSRQQSIDLSLCKRVLKEGRTSSESPVPPPLSRPTATALTPAPTAAVVALPGLPVVQCDAVPTARAPLAPPALRSASPLVDGIRREGPVGSNAAIGWEWITHNAVQAFLEDHGNARAGWDQLQLLIERYLKPLFVAHAAGSLQSANQGQGRATNYSALARRLHIGDGGTVKNHLTRFEERFSAMYDTASRAVAESSGSVTSS